MAQDSPSKPEQDLIPYDVLLRSYHREKKARASAETLLEDKSRELYLINLELQKNQDKLIQSSKMASLGVLAAGVAHEINNPIGFINSNMSTLKKYVAAFSKLLDEYQTLLTHIAALPAEVLVDNSALLEAVAQIKAIEKAEKFAFVREDIECLIPETLEGLRRVIEIVQNLKTFARLDITQAEQTDVHELIDSTLKIARNEIQYKCEVVRNFGNLPPIFCCAGQLNQVFLNLFVNAAQAISDKGSIRIDTSASDKHITVRITDTGKGISPEHLSEIFNPFFTTKPVGSGTGLGLAVSYSIIQKHHGTIDVTSEVGQGSVFTITLPIHPETAV